jgi:hypothetical protein
VKADDLIGRDHDSNVLRDAAVFDRVYTPLLRMARSVCSGPIAAVSVTSCAPRKYE